MPELSEACHVVGDASGGTYPREVPTKLGSGIMKTSSHKTFDVDKVAARLFVPVLPCNMLRN